MHSLQRKWVVLILSITCLLASITSIDANESKYSGYWSKYYKYWNGNGEEEELAEGEEYNITEMNITDPNATVYKKRNFMYTGNAGCNLYNGYGLQIENVELLCANDTMLQEIREEYAGYYERYRNKTNQDEMDAEAEAEAEDEAEAEGQNQGNWYYGYNQQEEEEEEPEDEMEDNCWKTYPSYWDKSETYGNYGNNGDEEECEEEYHSRMGYEDYEYAGFGICETGSNMTIRARVLTEKGFPQIFNVTSKICRSYGGTCASIGEPMQIDVCEYLDDGDCPRAGEYEFLVDIEWDDAMYLFVENFTQFTFRFQFKPSMDQTLFYEYVYGATAEEQQQNGQYNNANADEEEQAEEGNQNQYYENPYYKYQQQDDDNPYQDNKAAYGWWKYWHKFTGSSNQNEDDPMDEFAYETLYCHVPMKVVNENFNVQKYYNRRYWRKQRYEREQQEKAEAAEAAAALGLVGLLSLCCFGVHRRKITCGCQTPCCGCIRDDLDDESDSDDIIDVEEDNSSMAASATSFVSADGTHIMLPPRVKVYPLR